ncbi:snare associated Golgi protein [Rhizophagus diaphanus]|nr:snare associated Golgi protein [Rhizophagus diaphanus] [Rhizophagus sp. MUCL 43196]
MTEVTSLLGNNNGSQPYNSVLIPTSTAKVLDFKHRLLFYNNDKKWNSLKAILRLLLIFLVSTFIVYLILKICLPPLNEEQKRSVRLPSGIEDLQLLNKLLAQYMDQYYYSVMTVFVIVYIYLQTFSIPGSMWLSILGGALFSLVVALFLVCLCSAIGATNCYLLSHKFGKSFVKDKFSEKLDRWAEKLRSHSQNLFNYMIVLRLSPFPPNWFANIAAPHVGVPLKVFFIGTFFGVAAPSLIHVQAGLTIEHLTNASDFKIFSFTNVFALILIAFAVLLPVWIRRRFEKAENELNDENNQIENNNIPPVSQIV